MRKITSLKNFGYRRISHCVEKMERDPFSLHGIQTVENYWNSFVITKNISLKNLTIPKKYNPGIKSTTSSFVAIVTNLWATGFCSSLYGFILVLEVVNFPCGKNLPLQLGICYYEKL